MTAADDQIAAAAQAVQIGMAVAQQYHEAGGRNPGVGLAVSLPSVPDSQGRRPQGLNFDLDPSIPALRQPERPLQLTPNYGEPIIGGAAHLGLDRGSAGALDGLPWPAGQAQISSVARRSSVTYVPASSRQSWVSRLREAWATLLGR